MCGTQAQKNFSTIFRRRPANFRFRDFALFSLLQLHGRYYRTVSSAFINRLRIQKRFTDAYNTVTYIRATPYRRATRTSKVKKRDYLRRLRSLTRANHQLPSRIEKHRITKTAITNAYFATVNVRNAPAKRYTVHRRSLPADRAA